MNHKKAVVIGAGIAGIATSIRMANMGLQVEVYEKNSYPGGKLSEIKVGNYRFDAGPSLFTLPALVDELFTLSGEIPENHFQYIRLEEFTRYFYDDGLQLTAYAHAKKFAGEIASKTTVTENSVLKFLSKSAELYKLTADIFLYNSLHRLQTYTNIKALATFFQLYKIDSLRTMNEANTQYFKDERIVTLFNRFATYNGSNPFLAPATLNVIPHLEHNIGVFFPVKGMYSITSSLYELAKRKGVKFHFNKHVSAISYENKKVNGIKADNELMPADIVVSNIDIVHTYRKLLPNIKEPLKITNQSKSSSAIIFYWGIKKVFSQLHLHNIFFSNNYREEFDYIFNKKTIYHDPTVYINITSKYKPDDAPVGCENWFVMINVSCDSGQNWHEEVAKAKKHILKKLSNRLGENIENLIESEDVLTPETIEAKTASHLGALYGSNSNNWYSAFLRHANYSKQLKNLYFCGGSVHPGGGIPLSLLSAKIVCDFIKDHHA